jgi:hypothetical protein
LLFNQQQCFIYSTARFLSKLRAKKGFENYNNFWLVKILGIKNPYTRVLLGHITGCKAKKKCMCVYCHMSKKSRVGHEVTYNIKMVVIYQFYGKSRSHPVLISSTIKYFRWGRLFSQGTPVSSTNKTDHHNITEILLNISVILWWSVLLVEETGVPWENNRPHLKYFIVLDINTGCDLDLP